jgi:iron-sulfur cluster repair protein YtfE (RIC family)
LTDFFMKEHAELDSGIEQLRETADLMFLEPTEELARDIEDCFGFVNGTLVPHAQAEEKLLYPEFERLLGTPVAMQLLAREHEEIIRLATELGAYGPQPWQDELSHEERKHLRRLLYSLYALIRLHLTKEEEILIPLLEKSLEGSSANRLMEALRQSA